MSDTGAQRPGLSGAHWETSPVSRKAEWEGGLLGGSFEQWSDAAERRLIIMSPPDVNGLAPEGQQVLELTGPEIAELRVMLACLP